MHNPLTVEQHYQTLLVTLAYPHSSLQDIVALDHFLSFLGQEAGVYESYIRDCLPRLKGTIQELPTFGLSPQPLASLHRTLAVLADDVSGFALEPMFAEIEHEIRLRLAELYLYAGDRDRAWQVLDAGGDPGSTVPVPEEGREPLFERVRRWTAEVEASGHPVSTSLRIIQAHWESALQRSSNSCFVPVVEHGLTEGAAPASWGGMQMLELQITGAAGGEKDELHSDVAVFGVKDVHAAVWDTSARAARSVLEQMQPRIARNYVRGHATFRGKQTLHEGGSANLALAVLLIAGVTRAAGQREQYDVLSSVAITGDVDPDGSVMPVDEGTLPQKLEAVFYSPLSAVVVPRNHLTVAESLIAALSKDHPHRVLDVIGVRHVREVFYDRRVTRHTRSGLVAHTARRIWQKKTRSVALVASSGLVLLTLWHLSGSWDKIPVSVEYAGDRLTVQNRYGKMIGDITVGRATVEKGTRLVSTMVAQKGHGFGDFDGDHVPDIVFVRTSSDRLVVHDEVCAWSIQKETFLWRTTIIPRALFPEKQETLGGTYCNSDIVVMDTGVEGAPDVFVSGSHTPSFPGFVVRLNGRDGTIREQYVHVGHVADIEVGDVDQDGVKEIVACGVNNAYRRAFVAVLEVGQMDGCSPTQGEYRCDAPVAAREKYYILIPRTAVGDAFRGSSKGNSALFTKVDERLGRITACISDGLGPDIPPGWPSEPILNYTFDRHMRFLYTSTGDSYDLMVDLLKANGRLQTNPNSHYFDSLMRQSRRWELGVERDPL